MPKAFLANPAIFTEKLNPGVTLVFAYDIMSFVIMK